jgi:hypothetical protein
LGIFRRTPYETAVAASDIFRKHTGT